MHTLDVKLVEKTAQVDDRIDVFPRAFFFLMYEENVEEVSKCYAQIEQIRHEGSPEDLPLIEAPVNIE